MEIIKFLQIAKTRIFYKKSAVYIKTTKKHLFNNLSNTKKVGEETARRKNNQRMNKQKERLPVFTKIRRSIPVTRTSTSNNKQMNYSPFQFRYLGFF